MYLNIREKFKVGDHVKFSWFGIEHHGNVQLRERLPESGVEDNRIPTRDLSGHYMVRVPMRGIVFAHEHELKLSTDCLCSVKPIVQRRSKAFVAQSIANTNTNTNTEDQ